MLADGDCCMVFLVARKMSWSTIGEIQKHLRQDFLTKIDREEP